MDSYSAVLWLQQCKSRVPIIALSLGSSKPCTCRRNSFPPLPKLTTYFTLTCWLNYSTREPPGNKYSFLRQLPPHHTHMLTLLFQKLISVHILCFIILFLSPFSTLLQCTPSCCCFPHLHWLKNEPLFYLKFSC